MGSEKLLHYFNGDELAANVWQSKYAIEGEETPDDMHKRLAKGFARIEDIYQKSKEQIEKDYKSGIYHNNKGEGLGFNPLDGKSILSNYGTSRKELNEQSIYELFKDFKYVIPQGSIMATLGTNQIASLSNCWVIESPLDSYSGIHKADGDLIYYYKRRGGVGMDISKLRPANTSTNNAAKTSTGAISFMHRFSNTTREVGMNGRRAALMISIDVNHPDVMEFIKIKRDGTSVTGANISIKINNEFMKAVENDEDYVLRFPCDFPKHQIEEGFIEKLPYNELITWKSNFKANGNEEIIHGYFKKVKAKEYWEEIIKSAKDYAEPGLMYWDNIIDYDPAAVYEDYKPITSNPCGEQFLQANDSCRLMVHRLDSYIENSFTDNAKFDIDLFYKNVYEGTRLGDNLIDLEVEYIQKIIDKIKSDSEPESIKKYELDLWEKSKEICSKGRRIGMGITALGDTLAALGYKYDSDEALLFIEQIMYIKMEAELDCLIDLAILRGTFEGNDITQEYSINAEGSFTGKNSFYEFIRTQYPNQFERMCKYGRRSISWSTIAPTGSVSLLADNCTPGIEPLFMPFYMRRKKVNPGDIGTRVDFVDQSGDSWQEFPIIHPKFKSWIQGISTRDSIDWETTYTKEDLQRLFEKSPWYGSTANDIDWIKRVEVQAILQKYTTNAISSTINLPSTVTSEEVSNIYLEGWKHGLKGQTIYVDGSRSGVLVSTENASKSRDEFSYVDAIKRPKELDAEVHLTRVGGVPYYVVVGLLNNKPYEIFIENRELPQGKGKMIKMSRGNYKFVQEGYEQLITAEMTDEQAAITRLASTSLRHGADIKFLVEQLNKTPGDLFSFTKGLARVLKKYIPEGAKSTVTCLECGSDQVVFEEGCSSCKSCGSSKCG